MAEPISAVSAPPRSTLQAIWRPVYTFLLAALGGYLAWSAKMPLPWVIGAMLAVALLTLAGYGAQQPVLGRRAAQMTIGTSLGLYFTQEVIHEVASYSYWLLAGAAFSIVLSMLFSRVIQKLAGMDGITAIYSVALGASAEMAMQAQRAGANAAVVASAHAIRIILVVTSASMIAHWSGAEAVALLGPKAPELSWQYGVLFLFGAPLCGWLLHRLGVPNSWVLGPIFLAGAFAAHGLNARMSQLAQIAAQVMIGWGLGQHMTRRFFLQSPRILASAASVTLSMIAICVGVAWAVQQFLPMHLLTPFLSLAPGGMAEMAIVAKTFGIGAPVVTAFHFFRVISTIFLMRHVSQLLLRSGWVTK
jgi:hypothetical protein